MQNPLTTKKQHLEHLKLQNLNSISQIKQLTQQIQQLKWSIPKTNITEDIEQLKQSIRISIMPQNQQNYGNQIEEIHKKYQEKIGKQTDAKIIKYLQNRKQMLQKLQKLKPQGTLYQSHRRVILKEYLQQIRENNMKIKAENQKLEQKQIDIEGLKKQYERLVTELRNSSILLQASRVL